MNKKYIVENLEFDHKIQNTRRDRGSQVQTGSTPIGVWDAEGKTEDERIKTL